MDRKDKGKQVMEDPGYSTPSGGSLGGARTQGISSRAQWPPATSRPFTIADWQPSSARTATIEETTATATATKTSTAADATGSILDKRSTQASDMEIDLLARLLCDEEPLLPEIADDFIEQLTSFSRQLAKHRNSDVPEAKDVSLALDQHWNIKVHARKKRPGDTRQAHDQRPAVLRKIAADTERAAKSEEKNPTATESKSSTSPSKAPATDVSTPVSEPAHRGFQGTGATTSPSPSPGEFKGDSTP